MRFCPRNGGADAIGKGGARRKAGIRRKLGDIRLQKHDLLRPVRDFAQAKRQGQVDGITQSFNIFPQGAGGAAAHRVHGTAAAMAGHAVQCIRSIGGVKIIPLLLPCRQVRALPGQQFLDGGGDHRVGAVMRAVNRKDTRPHMVHAQGGGLGTAHLACTQLGHAVPVFGVCGGIGPQNTVHTAILCLAAGTNKHTAAHCRRGAHGINGIADILNLSRHIIAARANGVRPRQVEKGIRLHGQPGCGHALRQIRQVGGIAGNYIQVCILGQRYGPRAAGAADRHHGAASLQQPAAQCCAHGPGGAGHDCGLYLPFDFFHFQHLICFSQ